MKLLMYGVNKETVIKEDVDKYRLGSEKKYQQMNEIISFDGVEELTILTDEFRNEYYLYVDETIFSHGEFLRYLAEQTTKSLQEIILETYSKFNEDVLQHLFEVSSGYLSEPIGALDILESVEKAKYYANKIGTSGQILNEVFSEAIELTYYLKLKESMQPLNKSQLSTYIYLLQKKMGTLANKHFLVSGKDFEVFSLTKLLLSAGAQTITVIQVVEEESIRQVDQLIKWLSVMDAGKVFAATKKSLHYRLSKSDAAILDSSEIHLLDKETIEKVAVIRQTKKNQYLVDTSVEPLEMIDDENLNVCVINPNANLIFNDEQVKDATIIFEEEVQTQINYFMNIFPTLENKNEQTKKMTQ